jgi:hypothetical protein
LPPAARPKCAQNSHKLTPLPFNPTTVEVVVEAKLLSLSIVRAGVSTINALTLSPIIGGFRHGGGHRAGA